ncbi:MAG: Gfo/Idh/MocA family oxidoreductase [Hyphomicrobiales bacterium]
MVSFSSIGAAVIGTGFIGTVHIQALRRMGVTVCGVLGSSEARGAEASLSLGVPKAYGSLEDLLSDADVKVVHVTSPNQFHFSQVKQTLAAGRHVVCEKPLTMTSAEAAELVELANSHSLITAVNYNIRYYPLNQHSRAMVAAGELGDVRLITGHYMQDWLLFDTDWNWRLEADQGGLLRAFGDIGTHWIDLTSFVSGLKITSVMAELSTFVKTRQQPVGPVETFSQDRSGETVPRTITTEDSALLLLRYENGARGSVVVSQVSPGKKNSLCWQIDGSRSSASWDSEKPDHLHIGHRDRPNETLQRDAALMNRAGAAATALPGGHTEGFADSFFGLFREIYAAIDAGLPPENPGYASFADGCYEMYVCDAVLESARLGRWVDVKSAATS